MQRAGFFSHIYVERRALDYPATADILKHFPKAEPIIIRHYKDVFNRKHQSFGCQKASPCLIVAKKEGQLVYPGAPVCQSFGHHYFYYTSCMMNCIYDCEYCYLQGMYPSGNVVLFVNLEDIFAQVDALLRRHPVYLCISYDTDLLAFEKAAGLVRRWYMFARERPELTIEVRTKSGAFHVLDDLTPLPNVIFAWTLSPQPVIERYEHQTAAASVRIKALRQAAAAGFPVRVCFDPLLYVPDFKSLYGALMRELFREPLDVMDASIGVFRISVDYLKNMRRQRPESPLLWYPFVLEEHVYHYGQDMAKAMTGFVRDCLKNYIPEDKIFIWDGGESNEMS